MNKQIKSLTIVGFLAFSGLGAVLNGGTAPDQGAGQQRACVILNTYQTYIRLNNGYQYTDIAVYCSSSSSNALRFPGPVFFDDRSTSTPIPVAQAIADLLQAGYKIEWHGDNIVATK